MQFPLQDVKEMAIRSIVLVSFVVTFGVCLPTELREMFEEQYKPYKNLFGINVSGSALSNPTVFDVYYDVERLSWEIT